MANFKAFQFRWLKSQAKVMKQKRKSIVQSSAKDWHTLSKSRIFYQNSQFGLKSLIFGQTIKIMVKYSGIFSDFNIGLASNSLSRKNILSKRLSKFKNTNFWAKNVGKISRKIDTFSTFEHTQNVSIFGEGLYIGYVT